MVRKLFILRHGEAESGRNWLDRDRPLTESGKKKVLEEATRLSINRVKLSLILCSSSRRTKETATQFLEPLNEKPRLVFLDELYNTTFDRIQHTIMKLDPKHENVVLIGHNPSVSELATYLLGVHFLSLSPGQLMAIELSVDDWQTLYKGCGMLIEG